MSEKREMDENHTTSIMWSGANPGGRMRLPESEQGRKKKMKRVRTLSVLILLVFATVIPLGMSKKDYMTIQDGVLTYATATGYPNHYYEENPLTTGFDEFGYNYQSHMFKGYYCNVYLCRDAYPPFTGDVDAYLAENPDAVTKWYWYPDVMLVMKWNDAWLSNKDRDGDGVLDRPDPAIGSGAWETNHQWGINSDGSHWYYFLKIVAVPADAYRVGAANAGTWYSSDDIEIGRDIWGSFAIIQEISNDPMLDDHGCIYNPPSPTGFGYYKP